MPTAELHFELNEDVRKIGDRRGIVEFEVTRPCDYCGGQILGVKGDEYDFTVTIEAPDPDSVIAPIRRHLRESGVILNGVPC